MDIKFSRHAKRRAQLYGIPEDTIVDILRNMELVSGECEIIQNVPGFVYPLKIVIDVADNIAIIITNYPLKKGRRHAGSL